MSINANRQNDANLGMITGVNGYMVTNAAAVTALNVAIMATYKAQIAALIDPIQDTMGKTSQKTNGITLTKKEARLMAIEVAINVAKTVHNYALDHIRPDPTKPPSLDNPTNYAMQTLMEFMEPYTGAFLYSIADEYIVAYLENIWLEASSVATVTPPLVNPLLVYGFKDDEGEPEDEDYEPGTLTQFETVIQIYSGLRVTPRAAIIARKTQNQKLKGLFQQAFTILEKLDNTFELVKSQNLDLYNGYKSARIVILQTFATQILGIVTRVTNLETGSTVVAVGAKVTVTGSPYPTTGGILTPNPVEVQIGADGKYTALTPKIKSIYTVKCTLPGYQAFTKNDVTVKKGDKTTVNIVLVPVQSEPPAPPAPGE
jgi:hypothetical protein